MKMNQFENLRYLIDSVQKEGNKTLLQLLKPLNITPNQAEVLKVLNTYGDLSMKELGNLLICERQSPSRLVQRLVLSGYVCKTKSDTDNRKSVLSLTESGKVVLPLILEKEAVLEQQVQKLLKDKITLEELNSLLSLYISNTESEQRINRRKERV